MIASVSKRRDSRLSGSFMILALLPMLYLMAAYIWDLWPLSRRGPATCPVDATNYQVFVDPTGSNQDIRNWSGQARLFAQKLGSCSNVSFWTITNNSSAGAAFAEPIVFPLLDKNAAGESVITVTQEIQQLRQKTEDRILKMMTQKGAPATDAIGIFNKLVPDNARRNVLVVFSDGQESAGRVDLENGYACVSKQSVSRLVDLALEGRAMSGTIDNFEAIDWVIPANSGRLGCNSRDELRLFWETFLARISQTRKFAPLRFDTNIFSGGTNDEAS
jgi:hypothetical protein